MLRSLGYFVVVALTAFGCGSSVPIPPTTLPEVAYDRYESIQFHVNSEMIRPKKMVSIAKGQKIKMEFRFRRVVFWKELNDREALISISVIDARKNPPTEFSGKSLDFVSSHEGLISFAGEIAGDLPSGRYGLVVYELGVPRLERVPLFTGTLNITDQ